MFHRGKKVDDEAKFDASTLAVAEDGAITGTCVGTRETDKYAVRVRVGMTGDGETLVEATCECPAARNGYFDQAPAEGEAPRKKPPEGSCKHSTALLLWRARTLTAPPAPSPSSQPHAAAAAASSRSAAAAEISPGDVGAPRVGGAFEPARRDAGVGGGGGDGREAQPADEREARPGTAPATARDAGPRAKKRRMPKSLTDAAERGAKAAPKTAAARGSTNTPVAAGGGGAPSGGEASSGRRAPPPLPPAVAIKTEPGSAAPPSSARRDERGEEEATRGAVAKVKRVRDDDLLRAAQRIVNVAHRGVNADTPSARGSALDAVRGSALAAEDRDAPIAPAPAPGTLENPVPAVTMPVGAAGTTSSLPAAGSGGALGDLFASLLPASCQAANLHARGVPSRDATGAGGANTWAPSAPDHAAAVASEPCAGAAGGRDASQAPKKASFADLMAGIVRP